MNSTHFSAVLEALGTGAAIFASWRVKTPGEQCRPFRNNKNAYQDLWKKKDSLVYHRRFARDLSEHCRGGPKIKVAGVFRVLDLVTG